MRGEEPVQADLADSARRENILKDHGIDKVMHFAAPSVAPESVEKTLKYSRNIMAKAMDLHQVCEQRGVKKIIFSSTAAVSGIPAGGIALADTHSAPIESHKYLSFAVFVLSCKRLLFFAGALARR